jgi:hypothetical protein
MCSCKDRIKAPRAAPPPASEMLLLEIKEQPTEPLIGQVTGIGYKFHVRKRLYVDVGDAAFMLGPEFDIIEED